MDVAETANNVCAQENGRRLSTNSHMDGWGIFFIYHIPSSLLKKDFAELAVFICARQISLVLSIMKESFAVLEPN